MDKHRKKRHRQKERHTGRLHIPAYFGSHKLHKKDVRNAAIIVTCFVICTVCILTAIRRWERATYTRRNVAATVEADTVFSAPKSVTVEGVEYQHRRNLDVYLFMGVDAYGPVNEMNPLDGGGQADVLLVIVLDNNARTWRILQLNRDTLADVTVLGLTGKTVGVERKQIALAHAYGSGKEDSCRNTVNTVSSLLWQQPFTGYIAMNLEGIGVINDGLGGVPVLITSDFSLVDPTLEEGTVVNLNGSQALNFLQARRHVDDQSNLSRMNRHRQYLDALLSKVLRQNSLDLLNVYVQADPYTVSSMEDGMIVTILDKLLSYEQLELMTIEGESVLWDGSNGYVLDEKSLQNVILELFYSKNP